MVFKGSKGGRGLLLLPAILGAFYYGFSRRHEFVHGGQEERFKAAADNAAAQRTKLQEMHDEKRQEKAATASSK